jgi:serine/threonine-protein kinase
VKSCPTCRRLFPDDAAFCPEDGSGLLSASQVPTAPDQDPRVGALLCERYHVRRIVADGGMGRVYEALDTRDQARVAVKVLHPEVSTDDVTVARFRREFEVSALLPHDFIIEVRDFQATADGASALVMEFLDGEELRKVLQREKRIAPARLVRMLSQAAIGLDEAHRRNLVHRDLKPENLFLCGTHEGDRTKVLDFGSVKDKSTTAKKLTMLGTTIGSPFYMAPEQAQGSETLDARADVWALGVITYECLTGTVPFSGNNGPSILLAILTKEPTPPTVLAKDGPYPVPPTMDEVIEVALAKNPNIRTRSVGALADAVGHAYGLSGDHRAWADTPEETLRAQIAAALPAILAAPHPPPTSLGSMDAAFHAAAEPSSLADESFAMGVPKGPPKWLVPAIVAGLVLVVGVAVALLR